MTAAGVLGQTLGVGRAAQHSGVRHRVHGCANRAGWAGAAVALLVVGAGRTPAHAASPSPAPSAPSPAAVASWPGAAGVRPADAPGALGGNLSGLVPAGASSVWAVRDAPSALLALDRTAGLWRPRPGWGSGRTLRYPDGTGAPDAEAVAVAVGDPARSTSGPSATPIAAPRPAAPSCATAPGARASSSPPMSGASTPSFPRHRPTPARGAGLDRRRRARRRPLHRRRRTPVHARRPSRARLGPVRRRCRDLRRRRHRGARAGRHGHAGRDRPHWPRRRDGAHLERRAWRAVGPLRRPLRRPLGGAAPPRRAVHPCGHRGCTRRHGAHQPRGLRDPPLPVRHRNRPDVRRQRLRRACAAGDHAAVHSGRAATSTPGTTPGTTPSTTRLAATTSVRLAALSANSKHRSVE